MPATASPATATVVLPYPRQALFDLVADVERYPEFLPWLGRVRVLERSGDTLRAAVSAAHKGYAVDLEARIRLSPPSAMRIQAVGWWFRRLESRWDLDELPDGGTRVSHALDYALSVPLLSAIARPMVEKAVPRVAERFVARAHALYG